jgi:hypothetical protein
MPFVIWLPLLDDVRLRVAPPVCVCPRRERTMMTGATRNSVQRRFEGIVLILGILSQRLFSPIGSTGNMDTVPKSDRNRQCKIEVRYIRCQVLQQLDLSDSTTASLQRCA